MIRLFETHDRTLGVKMIGSQDDGINGKLIENFTTILTTSKHQGCSEKPRYKFSFYSGNIIKACSLITVDDG